jgi:hypothetical protein
MDCYRNFNWADGYRDYTILCFVTGFFFYNFIFCHYLEVFYFKLLHVSKFVVFQNSIYLRLYFKEYHFFPKGHVDTCVI